MIRNVGSPLVRTLLGLAASAVAAAARPQSGELGRIEFPTSGSPAAQEHFLRGTLLLHSFEYSDAAEEFRKAQGLEPDFAMAFWGEAMTHNHPLWMEQDRDAARKCLARLAPTREARIAKAPTESERMYLRAVEALYGDGEKPARDRAYAEEMRRLHERFPEDLDAAALYALALLGTCEGKRDVAVYMKAAAVAEGVFAANPRHPGAAHYLIHCYDDPVHAPLGMRAARVYAKIAPAAVHALHMPSHIFVASGLWREAVASNEASWKASVERAERRKLSSGEHSFHALSWLEYSALQLGRWRDARRTLALMAEDAKAGSAHASESLSAMRAAWIVETRRCSADALPESAREPLDAFARGWCALSSGDRAAAEKALAEMRSQEKDGGSGSYDPHRKGTAASVLEKELEARLALSAGDGARAEALAHDAASEEDAMTFESGPPAVIKPAHELAGEILLALDRPADARREFETSLSRAPGRSLSLLGLARAASKTGDASAADDAYARLAGNWKEADEDLAELREVRR